MNTYLESLTVRLALGAAQLPEEIRQRHGQFLLDIQRPDGGFAGREGGSDLYYTGFALRGLAILGLLDGEVATHAADFLKSKLAGQESIVDFFSLIYGAKLIESAAGIDVFAQAESNWADSVASELEKLRCDDGGYAKAPAGRASSTYHSFLVLLCRQLIQRPVPDPDAIVRFIQSQECEGGGFREIRVSKRAGTNPTAAAVGSLKILDALTDDKREGVIDFLGEMQMDSGGLRANSRIPIADTLSTFTGIVTLLDLNDDDAIDYSDAFDYVTSLENPDGGFYGAEWDHACDVEYTFYGLGSLALLSTDARP